jgi:hypothetical protein
MRRRQLQRTPRRVLYAGYERKWSASKQAHDAHRLCNNNNNKNKNKDKNNNSKHAYAGTNDGFLTSKSPVGNPSTTALWSTLTSGVDGRVIEKSSVCVLVCVQDASTMSLVQELFARQNPNDFLFMILVLLNACVTPVKSAMPV